MHPKKQDVIWDVKAVKPISNCYLGARLSGSKALSPSETKNRTLRPWPDSLPSTQFRAEAFNFTNTELPNAPIAVLGQANFGQIITFSGSRTMQFAIKILL